jgi:flagellar biosynthesis protein FlhG
MLPAPGGFSVLLAGSGMVEYSRMTPEVRDQLLDVIAEVRPASTTCCSTPAPASPTWCSTPSPWPDEVLMVATPEPTSLTDAYATIKVLATTQGRARCACWSTRREGRRGPGVRHAAAAGGGPLRQPGPGSPGAAGLLGEVPLDAGGARHPCSAGSC